MAITLDPSSRLFLLDSDTVTSEDCWRAWALWFMQGDNAKYPRALTQVGGEALSGGRFNPLSFFLENGWRIKPMEASHELNFIGNMEAQGGASPFADTYGVYRVRIRQTVPVMAQAIATSGTIGPTASEIADAMLNRMIEGGVSLAEMLRIQHAVSAGLVVGAGTDTERFKSMDGLKDRLIVTVDEYGNRTAIVADGT